MKIIDISVTLTQDLPVWPGDPPLEIQRLQDISRGDPVTVSRLSCGVHAGTHVDAPLHFLPGGVDVAGLRLEDLVGPAVVLEVGSAQRITPADLVLPPGTQRVLIKSSNSALWSQSDNRFQEDFAGLTAQAAVWLMEQGVRLVGTDYLSVQLFEDSGDTHRILLENRVVVLEGLNLAKVEPGVYFLVCLPLKLANCEGAPARAVLWKV